jgi:hypothetical protein
MSPWKGRTQHPGWTLDAGFGPILLKNSYFFRQSMKYLAAPGDQLLMARGSAKLVSCRPCASSLRFMNDFI